MTEESYDGSVSLTRKLDEEEIKQLRIQLLPLFVASGGLGVEDITDFLDYTFAMISNNKTVDYVINELIGMEMDFCTPDVASKAGKELASFINEINNGGEGQQEAEEGNEEGEEEDVDESSKIGSRVVSLKVCVVIRVRDRKISCFALFQSLTWAISAFTLVIFSPQTRGMLSPCLAPLELPEWVEKPVIKKGITTKKTRKRTTTRAAIVTTTTTIARVVAITKISVRTAARSHVTNAVMIAEAAVVTIDEEEEMVIVEVVEETDEVAEKMMTDEAAEETMTDEAVEETMIVEEEVEAAALSIPLRLIV